MCDSKHFQKEVVHSMLKLCNKQKYVTETRLNREKIGIFPAQHRLLMELSTMKTINQRDLSMKLNVSPATVTVSIKNLVKEGYIIKQNLEKDNRYNMLEITDKGKGIVEKSLAIFDSIDEKMFRSFSDEELSTLNNMLTRMYNNLSEQKGRDEQ